MKTFCMLCVVLFSFGCGGYSSHSNSPAPPSPGVMPVLLELSPDNTHAGGPAFTLTVNGSKFATNAVVNWNSTRQATTYITGNQLMVKIAAAAIATPGTIAVTVTNPGTPGSGGIYGGGGTTDETSKPVNFTIQ